MNAVSNPPNQSTPKGADKVSVFATCVSVVALIVSGTQVYVAHKQGKVSSAQVVETFIPHLQNPETRDAALLAMVSFEDQEFVTELAARLKAPKVLEALQTEGSEAGKLQAKQALADLDSQRKNLIDAMYSSDKTTRLTATTTLVRQWSQDPTLGSFIVRRASNDTRNTNGTINSLVVLRELPPTSLRAIASELSPFLESAKGNGPQTAELVEQVNERSRSLR